MRMYYFLKLFVIFVLDMCARYNSFKRIPVAELISYLDNQGNLTTLSSTCGMLLCTRGEATFRMANLTCRLQASHICLYRPATRAHVLSISPDFEAIVFRSTMDFVLPVIEQALSGREVSALADAPCVQLLPGEYALVRQQMSVLIRGLSYIERLPEDAPALPLLRHAVDNLGRSLLFQVFFLYVQHRPAQASPPQGGDLIVHRFMLDLIQFYKQQRQVEFYADRQHLSPRYFSSIIREHTGDPALRWIVNYVISGLKQSLSDPSQSMKSIAAAYHFSSATLLSRYFRQYTGVSPRTFRKEVLSGGG